MASDIIRRAEIRDADALCRLNREFNGDDTADASHIRQALAGNTPEICLVCEQGGELVGFVCGICFSSLCYRHPVAQITEMYVSPSARRTGVGRALMDAMIEHLTRMGACDISLLTGQDNIPARHLYESCGFIHEDERFYQLNIH